QARLLGGLERGICFRRAEGDGASDRRMGTRMELRGVRDGAHRSPALGAGKARAQDLHRRAVDGDRGCRRRCRDDRGEPRRRGGLVWRRWGGPPRAGRSAGAPGGGAPPAALAEWPRAAALAGGAAVAAFVILLYPGLKTPRPTAEAGRQVVEAAAAASGSGNA